MATNNKSYSVNYATLITVVKENPGHNSNWYGLHTKIENATFYLTQAVEQGTLRKESNLPILGGYKYYPV